MPTVPPARAGSDRHSRPARRSREPAQAPAAVAPGLATVPAHAHQLTPAAVLTLQRTAGNAAVSALLRETSPATVQRGKSKTPTNTSTRRQPATHRRQANTPAVTDVTAKVRERRAQVARRQAAAMETLVAMYVPEGFDTDGSPGAQPAHAHTAPQHQSEVDLLRTKHFAPPRVGGREAAPVPYYPARFESRYFHYEIQLVNADTGTVLAPETGVDPAAPFPVLRRTIKGSGRAQGRPNRFVERWAHNPAYWQAHGGLAANKVQADQRAEAHELLDHEMVDAASPPQDFVALSADATQPYVFYVSTSQRDPSFAHDQRRYQSAAGFDRDWGNDSAARKSQTAVSLPPQVPRQDAGRSPAGAMGGTQAYEYQGAAGHGGRSGVHLASHEWCHLVGDGDGGPDAFANLVIGTNAVNTEQLSMELALRDYRAQLAALNCSIVLTVKVLTEDSQVGKVRGFEFGTKNVANWISYDIAIVNSTDRHDARRIPVHRQVMDGKRGTITRSEFSYLHNEVRAKVKRTTEHLKAAHDAGSYTGSPAQPTFGDPVMAFAP